jgi:hypothetical protein
MATKRKAAKRRKKAKQRRVRAKAKRTRRKARQVAPMNSWPNRLMVMMCAAEMMMVSRDFERKKAAHDTAVEQAQKALEGGE